MSETPIEYLVRSIYGDMWTQDEEIKLLVDRAKRMESDNKDLFKLFTLWILVHKRSVFLEADFSKKDKESIVNYFGYSSNILEE